MWRVREVVTRKVRLDFSSSGQRERDVTQIIADGTVLANAIELTDWKGPSVQLIVCEECGTEHCEPGGWVAPRWTGSHVILLPDFARMADDDWALREYRPPDYVSSRGIPILEESLATAIPAFRWSHELALLTGQELVRAMQWAAPMNILGRFPEPPRVRRGDVIATSESDLGSAIDALEADIERLVQDDAPLVLGVCSPEARPITFYVDALGGREWTPSFRLGAERLLALSEDLVVAPRRQAPAARAE